MSLHDREGEILMEELGGMELKSPIARLDEIENLTLEVAPGEKSKLLDTIAAAIKFASELAEADFSASVQLPGFSGRSLSLATTMAMQSVNALLAAASVKCNIQYPEAEIQEVMDSAGDVILRCDHQPVHEWDRAGHRRK
jgi:hypothetical protein